MSSADAILQTVRGRLEALDTDMPTKAHDAGLCPIALLGHLAWSRGLDYWSSDWPEATRRELIRQTPANLRRRGTRAAIDAALTAFSAELQIEEWWQQRPLGEPGTARALVEASASIAGSPEAQAAIGTLLEREGRASVRWNLVLHESALAVARATAAARLATLFQLQGAQRGA